jgi:hypothetical protein
MPMFYFSLPQVGHRLINIREVDQSTTIAQVKQQLAKQEKNESLTGCDLNFNGKPLRDDATLDNCGVRCESTLQLPDSLAGGVCSKIFTFVPHDIVAAAGGEMNFTFRVDYDSQFTLTDYIVEMYNMYNVGSSTNAWQLVFRVDALGMFIMAISIIIIIVGLDIITIISNIIIFIFFYFYYYFYYLLLLFFLFFTVESLVCLLSGIACMYRQLCHSKERDPC